MQEETSDQLLGKGTGHLEKFHEIVRKAIEEEKLIVNNLLHPPREMLSRGQKISDRVARFGGSWKFIIFFTIVLITWIVYNVMASKIHQFDPYPFILMNLVLSCLAALQAPVIMMSQNRQEEKDRMRAENDYLVNLKAELEIRNLHKKLDLLLEGQIKDLYESQERQMEILAHLHSRVESLCIRNEKE